MRIFFDASSGRSYYIDVDERLLHPRLVEDLHDPTVRVEASSPRSGPDVQQAPKSDG